MLLLPPVFPSPSRRLGRLTYGRAGRRRTFGWRTDFTQDPVLDPVFIPPLLGIHLYACNHHAEMHMVAEGHACAPLTPMCVLLPRRQL